MADDLLIQIGKRVRELREQRGLKQAHLAQGAMKTIETISNLENGRTSPGIKTLSSIARILDVPLAAFFTAVEGTEVPERDPAVFSLHSRLSLLPPEDREVVSVLVDALAARYSKGGGPPPSRQEP